ncbi:MAG: DUF5362 family protein [candidate division WOR-3 bacterium]|nr:DUF5362 family protein [candidate division WOR-3 bacterium]
MELESFAQEEVINHTRTMSGWLRLLAIANIVFGAFFVISIVGIIPGGVLIWQGLLLNRAANGSRGVSSGNLDSLTKLLNPLKIFFIIQGVLVLLGIFGWILALSIVGLSGIPNILKGGGFY